jgi:hypothetical protein
MSAPHAGSEFSEMGSEKQYFFDGKLIAGAITYVGGAGVVEGATCSFSLQTRVYHEFLTLFYEKWRERQSKAWISAA